MVLLIEGAYVSTRELNIVRRLRQFFLPRAVTDAYYSEKNGNDIAGVGRISRSILIVPRVLHSFPLSDCFCPLLVFPDRGKPL